MRFTTRVEVASTCPTCVVILKQTYHPNWTVRVNGKQIKAIIVFPFYIGVRLDLPGTYDITFSYTPPVTKLLLLAAAIVASCIVLFWHVKKK
jgi:hypothetical protein